MERAQFAWSRNKNRENTSWFLEAWPLLPPHFTLNPDVLLILMSPHKISPQKSTVLSIYTSRKLSLWIDGQANPLKLSSWFLHMLNTTHIYTNWSLQIVCKAFKRNYNHYQGSIYLNLSNTHSLIHVKYETSLWFV